MTFRVDDFGISDIGFRRCKNEDVIFIDPGKKFFILADGIGGHNAGEIAASLAVESMSEIMRAFSPTVSIKEACLLLRKGIAETNRKVF